MHELYLPTATAIDVLSEKYTQNIVKSVASHVVRYSLIVGAVGVTVVVGDETAVVGTGMEGVREGVE